jgi:hypothetical protein
MTLQGLEQAPSSKSVSFDHLEYSTISSPAEGETALNELSNELKEAVERNQLPVDPRLAVLNLSSDTKKNSDDQGLADVLQVVD